MFEPCTNLLGVEGGVFFKQLRVIISLCDGHESIQALDAEQKLPRAHRVLARKKGPEH